MKFEVGDIIQNNLALDYGIISNIYYDEFGAACIKVIYFNIPHQTFDMIIDNMTLQSLDT